MSIFDEAIKFAVDAHSGMMRKGGNKPYILHPLEVATIAGTITKDPEVLAAAVLHDTVEDTPTTIEDIREKFGERVAALVGSETEDKRPYMPAAESWRIRKEESLEFLRNATDPAVKILWLADKLSNMRSFYELWKASGNDFWKGFHQSDPSQQAWYYREIDELLGDFDGYDAKREYHDLVEKIFAGV